MANSDKDLANGVERGLALLMQGDLSEAIEQTRKLQSRHASSGSAYLVPLLAELMQGDERAASQLHARCIKLKSDAYSTHLYRALAWYFKYRTDEAIAEAVAAHKLRPQLPFALVVVALSQIRSDRYTEAFHNFTSAFALFAAPLELRRLRFRCLEQIEATQASPALHQGALDYLAESLLAPDRISPLISSLIALELEQKRDAQGVTAIEDIAGNELLAAALDKVIFRDPALELLLTEVRRYLLVQLYQAGAAPGLDEFAAKLAIQCFFNEFIYDETDDEAALVDELAGRLEAALTGAQEAEPGFAGHLLAVALYRPLHRLQGIDNLSAEPHSALGELLRLAVRNVRTEQRMAAEIPCVGKIEDAVSKKVKAQYEDNPYPRWLILSRVPSRADYLARAELQNDAYRPFRRPTGEDPVRILIAGCGTGQHALWVASAYQHADVTAIDISRASLAYASRMAAELGIGNVRFIECDILAVAELGRKFEVIESIGTLHHMASPSAGMKALVDVLEPDGVMRVGLYSELARRMVREIRQKFTADVIADFDVKALRHARHDILRHVVASDPNNSVYRSPDFYTVSGCRDFLCHVQEHRLTIPDIGRLLAENDLRFMGFTFQSGHERGRSAYRQRYPDDRGMLDLERWQEVETAIPDLFTGMYVFFARRAPSSLKPTAPAPHRA